MKVNNRATALSAAQNLADIAKEGDGAEKPKLRVGKEGFRFSPNAPGFQAVGARFKVASALAGIGKHYTCTYEGLDAADVNSRGKRVRKEAKSLAWRLRLGREVRPANLTTFRLLHELATRPHTNPEAAAHVQEVEEQVRAERQAREAAGTAAGHTT